MAKKIFLIFSFVSAWLCLFLNSSSGLYADTFLKIEEDRNYWNLQPYTNFSPSKGDYFLVDIENAQGYLINESMRTYSIVPVITGAKRTPTPAKEWVVREKDIKANRIFYSHSGEFFRMFLNGNLRTGYGIHGYAYFDYELSRGTKFLSWGCIWVADDVLDLIEESFLANDKEFSVITKDRVDISAWLEEKLDSQVFVSENFEVDTFVQI